ncbi:phasin family protein [Massilia sp. TSP1-1-2]|uniref:phasin family protein n=1 Tax=unclassified Massilia TaxID=2609279 RepID=UPI003CF0F471
MSTLPEQFSAASKSQVEAQMNFFQNFTARALESAQKIVALNLSVSRASMEKSSAAVVELLAAKDPRDLFALTNRTQESIDGLLAYNRQLMAIATGAGAVLADTVADAKPAAPQPGLALVKPEAEPEAEPKAELEAAPQAEPEAVPPAQLNAQLETELNAQLSPEPAAVEFIAPVAEPQAAAPAVAVATPAAPLDAKAKPIAKALGKVAHGTVAATPAAAPVPAVATKPLVVTGIKPVEASPPPAPVSGKPVVAQQQLDLPTAKSKKKK